MTAPTPHTTPVTHPRLEMVIAVLALLVALALAPVAPIVERLAPAARTVGVWLADLIAWERAYVAARAALAVLLVVVLIALVSACAPPETRNPNHLAAAEESVR